MQRLLGLVAGLTLLAAAAAPAAAQDVAATRSFTLGLRGGVSVPTGALAEEGEDGGNADMGFNVGGFIGFTPAAIPFGLRAELSYDRFGIDVGELPPGADFDGDWSILSGTLNAILAVPTQSGIRPYVIGGVGMYNVKASFSASEDGESFDFSDSETKVGLNGGAGLRFGLGGLSTFLEARYHTVFMDDERVSFVPVSFGIEF